MEGARGEDRQKYEAALHTMEARRNASVEERIQTLENEKTQSTTNLWDVLTPVASIAASILTGQYQRCLKICFIDGEISRVYGRIAMLGE